MVEQNGKPPSPTRRLLNLFGRRSKEELRQELKEELRRETFIENYTRALGVEAEKLLRTPYFIHEIRNTAEKIQCAEGIAKTFYGDGFENPIRYVFGVGSIFRRQMGHVENLKNIKASIETISDEGIFNNFYEVTSTNGDFDGFLVFRDMSEETKKTIENAFKRMLPPLPESMKEIFGGYEFHEDCSKTESELQKVIEQFESFQNLSLLKTHEKEILEEDPLKEVVPVVLYESPSVNPQLKMKIDERINRGIMRNYGTYLIQTWVPYASRVKTELPERYSEISENVLREAGKSDIKVSDLNNIADIFNKI